MRSVHPMQNLLTTKESHERSLVEVAIDEGVTWYMSKLMKRICNERLKI